MINYSIVIMAFSINFSTNRFYDHDYSLNELYYNIKANMECFYDSSKRETYFELTIMQGLCSRPAYHDWSRLRGVRACTLGLRPCWALGKGASMGGASSWVPLQHKKWTLTAEATSPSVSGLNEVMRGWCIASVKKSSPRLKWTQFPV